MGIALQNFVISRADPDRVRAVLVEWLGSKGFEPVAREPFFLWDDEWERGIALFSDGRWTILLYSGVWQDADRLRLLLRKAARAVLKPYTDGGAAWGYELFDDGKLVAAFRSTPGVIPEPSAGKSPKNGDPDLLCRLCDLPGLEGRVRESQEGAVPSGEEGVARFCEAIGALPAALGWPLVRNLRFEAPETVVGGFRMERLFFERTHARKPEAPELHSLDVTVAPMPNPFEEVPARYRRYLRALFVAVILLKPVFSAVGFLFRLCFAPRALLRPKGVEPLRPAQVKALEAELRSRSAPEVRQQGRSLINERFRCRITLPPGAEAVSLDLPQFVFGFKAGKWQVTCIAGRPHEVSTALYLTPGATVREDYRFTVGPLQARTIFADLLELRGKKSLFGPVESLEDVTRARHVDSYFSVIQTPDAVFTFRLEGAPELPPEAREYLDAAVGTFQLFSTQWAVSTQNDTD